MKHIFFAIFTILIYANCNPDSNRESMKEKEITVTGTAHNGKGGALIITENKETYYIGDLDFWEETILERKVEVSGYIQTENFKEEDLKDESGAWTQGMIGEKLTILKPKWKLIEE